MFPPWLLLRACKPFLLLHPVQMPRKRKVEECVFPYQQRTATCNTWQHLLFMRPSFNPLPCWSCRGSQNSLPGSLSLCFLLQFGVESFSFRNTGKCRGSHLTFDPATQDQFWEKYRLIFSIVALGKKGVAISIPFFLFREGASFFSSFSIHFTVSTKAPGKLWVQICSLFTNCQRPST